MDKIPYMPTREYPDNKQHPTASIPTASLTAINLCPRISLRILMFKKKHHPSSAKRFIPVFFDETFINSFHVPYSNIQSSSINYDATYPIDMTKSSRDILTVEKNKKGKDLSSRSSGRILFALYQPENVL
ncbi:hypothetical protein CDAR_546331 [Caerostris darwini]|uniref:Uncharacterized protein n=1 Tax=Caerostris darwini TaxID=1538125 RepID=A0AAV4RNY2_9ARAC|nr:hypothetical protein CDAR_546331 [Caerostris darwini]